jgi:hypothetical protein
MPTQVHAHSRKIMVVRTTILLREDVRDSLLREVGPRGLSKAINEILAKSIFSRMRSLFGVDQWLDSKGVRDESDIHQDL